MELPPLQNLVFSTSGIVFTTRRSLQFHALEIIKLTYSSEHLMRKSDVCRQVDDCTVDLRAFRQLAYRKSYLLEVELVAGGASGLPYRGLRMLAALARR